MLLRTRKMLIASAISLAMSGAALAGVSADQASKLGQSLTPLGGEKSANSDGTIPAWSGTLSGTDRYSDPFANEQPLFTITAANVDQYKAHLSDGQIAMLKKYPDTFRMPVYPTHRTASVPAKLMKAPLKKCDSSEPN